MIKKILKSAVALLTAGLIATPAFAAEWSVSGNVRADWDIMKSITEGGERGKLNNSEGEGSGESALPTGTQVDLDDSYVQFDLKGENANGSLLYYGDGRQEFVASASGESGNWTSTAKFSVRDDSAINSVARNIRDGNDVSATKAGDQTVAVKHSSSFYLKLGLTTPLDTFRQGNSYLLVAADGDAPHVPDVGGYGDLGDLDNRSNVALFGINVGGILDLGIALEAAPSFAPLGSAFASIGYGDYPASEDSDGISEGAFSTGPLGHNLGLRANLALGVIDIGLTIISAGEKGDAAYSSAEEYTTNYEASASAFGLGVGLNLGALTPYLNIWNPSSSSKNADGEDETTSSASQIGVELALGESSGVALSIVNRTTTRKDTPTGGTARETKNEVATFEIGYETVLGSSTFQVAYVSDSIKYIPDVADGPEETADVAVSWLKIRLNQSF